MPGCEKSGLEQRLVISLIRYFEHHLQVSATDNGYVSK